MHKKDLAKMIVKSVEWGIELNGLPQSWYFINIYLFEIYTQKKRLKWSHNVTMILWSKQIVVFKSSVVWEILALDSLYST